MLELNKFYQGDCLEVMKDIDDKSINHVICDLPYFKVVKESWDNEWTDETEYLNWCDSIFVEYKRILKDNGNIFLFTSRQYNRKISILLDKYFTEKRIIIWGRKRNFNTNRGRGLSSGYEPICYYCNGDNGVFNNIKIKNDSTRKEYTEGYLKDGVSLSDLWLDINSLPHNSKEKVNHPTQKPLKLIERIILMGTNENDIILDNCMGSGTTALSCLTYNRNFIGIEKVQEYIELSNNRIDEFKKQYNVKRLF